MIARLPRWVWIVVAVFGVATGIWRVRAWSPERYVPHQFDKFIGRIEANRWSMAGWLVADGYSDRWGQDKASLIDSGRSVFRSFRWIEIRRSEENWTFSPGVATVVVTLELRGEGSEIAAMAKDAAARATEPFVFTWRKTGPMPWQWNLTSMEQPQLTLRQWQASLQSPPREILALEVGSTYLAAIPHSPRDPPSQGASGRRIGATEFRQPQS